MHPTRSPPPAPPMATFSSSRQKLYQGRGGDNEDGDEDEEDECDYEDHGDDDMVLG